MSRLRDTCFSFGIDEFWLQSPDRIPEEPGENDHVCWIEAGSNTVTTLLQLSLQSKKRTQVSQANAGIESAGDDLGATRYNNLSRKFGRLYAKGAGGPRDRYLETTPR